MGSSKFRVNVSNGEGERKGTFDEYVNPGPNAVWNEAASSASHKLHRHDSRIVNAKSSS